MKFNEEALTGIEIEYDSGSIPPPFSHVYRLILDWSEGSLDADFVIHYTEREDISEDEIFEEGFTLDDDYSTKIKLNSVWKDPILEKLQETKWSPRQLTDEGISLAILEKGKSTSAKVPMDQEGWKLIAQDLIQAIYETKKKEAPLSVFFRVVDKEEIKDATITIFFQNRKVQIADADGEREVNWDYAIQLMKLIFTPDYNYEIARDQPGKKRGIYLDVGDGYWHTLGKGITNIDSDFDAVSRIEDALTQLI